MQINAAPTLFASKTRQGQRSHICDGIRIKEQDRSFHPAAKAISDTWPHLRKMNYKKKWPFGYFPNYLGFKGAFQGKKNLAAIISGYLLSKYHLTFTKEAVLVPATVYEDDSVEAIHPASASSALRALVFCALTKG